MWTQLGPGLAAVFTAAGLLLVSIVALAAGILWGGAVALHPELRACLRRGRLLTMALQVERSGAQPAGCGPHVKVLPLGQWPSSSYN